MTATVVVQCPTCESRFRIADDKVTDRGVRVRCTSCKNVFPVRKPGAAEAEVPGPGQTMELSSLSAKQVAKATGAAPARPPATKPPTGPVRAASPKPPTGPVRPAASTKPPTGPVRSTGIKPPTGPVKPVTSPNRPKTGPLRPGASKPPTGPVRADAAARKLDTDDLFGMDELTGDGPSLATDLDPPAPPPQPAAKPMVDFDNLELDTDPTPSGAANIDAPVAASAMEVAANDEPLELAEPARATGKVKTGPVAGAEQAGPRPPTPRPSPRRGTTGPIAPAATPPPPPPADPDVGPSRALVSSALTGLLGATLAIGVLVISALNDDSAAGWLGLAPGDEVVATRVVSGLYDTAAGKPVFFVRGRIENHGKRVHGPVRVTAELVADGAAEAKADALAGAEPTPEDVYSVRSADDAEKLARTLEKAKVPRKLQPGESIPFFALIADPPPDLVRHRLHVKVEPLDAWNPPSPAQASKVK